MTMEINDSEHCYKAVVDTIGYYLKSPSKAGEILSAQSILSDKNTPFRRVCQFIFLNVLRNKTLFEAALDTICKKNPKTKLKAAIFGAFAEISSSKIPAKASDGWVSFVKKSFSKSEAGFVNAVLRKLPDFLEKAKTEAEAAEKAPISPKSIEKLSIYYSHPSWLVEKWISQFGLQKAVAILKNNQIPSEVYIRHTPSRAADSLLKKYSQFLEKTEFENFHTVKHGFFNNIRELLDSGLFYIQDPSTFTAPKASSPKFGYSILDLCAAPGGKSRALADICLSTSQNGDFDSSYIVSVDFGENRMKNLVSNMKKVSFKNNAQVECNLLDDDLKTKLLQKNLPLEYDVVFLDAPCSNTGVLRRRPDARYRITPSDIEKCSKTQRLLLDKARFFVKRGGILTYSTCSIESEENTQNALYFEKKYPQFKTIFSQTLLPDTQNDGCGAFVFKRMPFD